MRGIFTAVGLLLVVGLIGPPASAVGALTGRIVTEVAPATYAPVPGTTVIAYDEKPGGGPGKVIATATSDSSGSFSLSGLTDPVCLKVLPAVEFAPGWWWPEYASDTPGFASYVQFVDNPPTTCTTAPDATLGDVQVLKAWASGHVVAPGAGGMVPVAGATVRYDPVDSIAAPKTATTDTNGDFYIPRGLNFDEYSVKVTARHYLGGYVGADGHLYAKWGAAVTWATGPIGSGDIVMATK